MSAKNAYFIVFANEKGGSGKSTTAVHVAVALSAKGLKVAAVDLDTRQRTFARYMENRVESVKRIGMDLPTPETKVFDPDRGGDLNLLLDELSQNYDFVIVDTPGRHSSDIRSALERADSLVTPINDSFVDLDLIGQVDPESYHIKRPSFYAELVWEARKARGKRDGKTVDWIVLRNRLQHLEARNMRHVASAMTELSKRVGFRIISGLSERVIYRELFLKGLTLLDVKALGRAGLGHVAARQELRDLIAGLKLSIPDLKKA
ncbi:chromosome partitioning protein [Zymomonas mobilis]|uniref:division plane positioning ATPase MipZ n=1 Tax=Zymomonas mobilis TaxID=542 RepID=UPI00026D89AC|nr:division plane positioning ATPase MipZ [Zymomonas mobilis]AFN56801.1 ATPase MipZ [Zymomonas mobilis subsp. mobilis ATCC 29191]TQK77768.1 chromosome partitioning protein [Zymomonas mobilis]TQL15586.1 chromosome partitioning protein [Zymomonas mobilis]GEB87154.1 ATPase [Zymomonas mobilis subsp. mobilis]